MEQPTNSGPILGPDEQPTVEAALEQFDQDDEANAAEEEWLRDRAADDAAMAELLSTAQTAQVVLDGWEAGPPGTDPGDAEWHEIVAGEAVAALRGLLGAIWQEAIQRHLPQRDGHVELPAPDEVSEQRLRAAAQHDDPVPDRIVQAGKAAWDRRTPDGATVGDPMPAGMDPEANWAGRCRRRTSTGTYGLAECDRPAGHTGQHLSVGPERDDGTGPMAITAVWAAESARDGESR